MSYDRCYKIEITLQLEIRLIEVLWSLLVYRVGENLGLDAPIYFLEWVSII